MTAHPNSSAATEQDTRRNPEMEKFVQITPVVMEGYPDACNVWLKVENQKFMVSPHSCETRGEAEWLRGMLCIALARVVAAQSGDVAQPSLDAVEGELDTIVQLIHKHAGIRQRVNVDLTGVEDAAKAILAAMQTPFCVQCGNFDICGVSRRLSTEIIGFDDAGADDDHPVKGITMGHIRRWFDRVEQHETAARFVSTALAGQPPAAPVETDALGVIESDRLFAEQILADFGTFEEGITDKEKLAQWIRNVRRASSTPDDPPVQSCSAGTVEADLPGHDDTMANLDALKVRR